MTLNGNLSWGLCLATLNRIAPLETCVRHALAQTRPPAEIVIVDASADWQDNAARIALLTDAGGVPLTYLQAPRKSLTVQRNFGIAAARADICFLIDDDSFMHPDCAEEIMRVYEHEAAGRVLAVAASDAPPHSLQGLETARKAGAIRDGGFARLRKNVVFRWFWREVALMSAERVFVPYDGPYQRSLPKELAGSGLEIRPISLASGYRMTARRSAALAHPFEDAFQSYCPAEDLDFFYRVTRHGYLVKADKARLYHHEVAATRIKRQAATILSITNVAYLVRRHSQHPVRHMAAFAVMLLRRLPAEVIKDIANRRWRLEQARAVLRAIPLCVRIFRHDRQNLAEWYKVAQSGILSPGSPTPPRVAAVNRS